MSDQHSTVGKIKKPFYYVGFIGSVGNHIVAYSRKLNNFFGNRHMRINKGTEGFFYLPAFYKQSANFGYAVVRITKSRCFNIENYKLAVKALVALAINGGNGIVNKIRFAAVNRFNILTRFFKSLNGIHNLGKSLNNAVVGYRNGFMSPVRGTFY